MEKVQWKVEGMDCNTCAISIHRFLEKQGMKNVSVNFATGDVIFDATNKIPAEKLSKGISELGYTVVSSEIKATAGERKKFLSNHLQRFLFCLPFTLILMLHMIPGVHIHWLMNHWVQFALTVPVYLVGMSFFGKSALKSIRNGVANMNLLIAVGATAAFIYSLYGSLTGQPGQFMFYETTATIITLVFFGNLMEESAVHSTQRALNKLAKSQKVMANMIAFDDKYQEQIFLVENSKLKVGDLVLIKTGEQVPIDCKILWGNAQVNEAIITGESMPLIKGPKEMLIGGSIISEGTIKAQVTAVGNDTVLSGIINMVKQAQGEKPPVQKLADRISAVFIPSVLIIAVITLSLNWIILGDFTTSLLRSIAVLVIACPCAMGLATPAAIAVGLGRAARSGILVRNASVLETFRKIRQVVFDKTGTLTTGEFRVAAWESIHKDFNEEEFKCITYSLEKYSNHPIAKSVARAWKSNDEISWKAIREIKGRGMEGEDREGNIFKAGSIEILPPGYNGEPHNIFITKNDEIIGWVEVTDDIRKEAKEVIEFFHNRNIKTVLLSGDRKEKTEILGKALGIDAIIAEQTPEQKLQKVASLNAEIPTAMVGDGINDAPALAKASIGISMNDASHLAMQSADVVLVNSGLRKLPLAMGLGKHTYITIKQNLFWAFAYNIIAIPIAATGLLTPTFAALVMGFSDVILGINSVRLFVKKVD